MAGWSGANNTKVKIPGPREVTRWGQSLQDQALNFFWPPELTKRGKRTMRRNVTEAFWVNGMIDLKLNLQYI